MRRSKADSRPVGRWWAVLAVATMLTLVVAACGSGSSSFEPPNGDSETGTRVEFNPANFVDPTLDTNPFHPLKPGLQWVRGGTTEVGSRVVPHEVISTMTDVIRVIDGVKTIAMLDESTDSGEVSQIGMDYLALDKDGNVWILGGYTEDYEGGEYTNTDSAWLGNAEAQSIGILAPAAVEAHARQRQVNTLVADRRAPPSRRWGRRDRRCSHGPPQ